MVKNYELYFILDAETSAEKRKKEIEKIEETIQADFGATNISTTDEGAKKLAYAIGKTRLGQYVLMTFDVPYENAAKVGGFEKKLNVSDTVLRYLLTNVTIQNARIAKESINKKTEVKSHQDLNKGKITTKKDLMNHLGIKAVNYRDAEFIRQFASPYHKIFHRKRTGNTAKNQRAIAQAIKRARHMALLPFTPGGEVK